MEAFVEKFWGTWTYRKIITVYLQCIQRNICLNKSLSTINIYNQRNTFGSPCTFKDLSASCFMNLIPSDSKRFICPWKRIVKEIFSLYIYNWNLYYKSKSFKEFAQKLRNATHAGSANNHKIKTIFAYSEQ